jgi:hypothetical protein
MYLVYTGAGKTLNNVSLSFFRIGGDIIEYVDAVGRNLDTSDFVDHAENIYIFYSPYKRR